VDFLFNIYINSNRGKITTLRNSASEGGPADAALGPDSYKAAQFQMQPQNPIRRFRDFGKAPSRRHNARDPFAAAEHVVPQRYLAGTPLLVRRPSASCAGGRVLHPSQERTEPRPRSLQLPTAVLKISFRIRTCLFGVSGTVLCFVFFSIQTSNQDTNASLPGVVTFFAKRRYIFEIASRVYL